MNNRKWFWAWLDVRLGLCCVTDRHHVIGLAFRRTLHHRVCFRLHLTGSVLYLLFHQDYVPEETVRKARPLLRLWKE